MDISVLVIGLLITIAAVVGWMALRWRRVLKGGGVNVALRWRYREGDAGWHLGIGRYHGEQFLWFRVLSLRSGPDRVLSRDDLEISRRRQPSGIEIYSLPADATVLGCESRSGRFIEIAMGPGPLTGFLSWLESAPPGHQMPRAS
ncbi:DUF2550 domain-containing protein [Haloechinothrix sp. LS1_15]|uniref:DUF2550 domain-containing protein n=1 Tax=Haloechinothrix sp. LS1_15 TaxID=2652248 RepID=UPI0029450B22|nr:DUF2550 domain-containing protein [Haloechinothrix sp. LS1_15]MDV6011790.1 DUF2550 domain-containing protein [Haloechinothrix sp. LS1_15]